MVAIPDFVKKDCIITLAYNIAVIRQLLWQKLPSSDETINTRGGLLGD